MRQAISLVLGAFALAAPALIPAEARADDNSIDACGDIFVDGNAECTIYVGPVCEGMCTPVTVTAACAAELRANCAGQCNASAEVECVGSCEADCHAQCDVDPGEFNCLGSCQADCSASCEGRCSADSNSAECKASCEATCSGDCNARCEVVPPDVDCDAKCEASCTGSCQAQANIDCQVDCQADGYVDCRADLEGGCKLRCQKPEGALFCNGQYVDVQATIDDCVAALKALLNVMVYAHGDASCEGNTCHAEGEVGCSCDSGGSPVGALGLVVLGLALRRRRRAA